MHGGGGFLDTENEEDTTLPIKEQITLFLKTVQYNIENGLKYSQFQELKRMEFFIYLKTYYSQNELWHFFKELIIHDTQFRSIIEDNYTKIKTVEEFAQITCMAISTFQRKFKKEFNMSVGRWLNDRKAEALIYMLKRTNERMEDIAEKMNFSSLSHMGTFCKKRWGKSPREIRYGSHSKM